MENHSLPNSKKQKSESKKPIFYSVYSLHFVRPKKRSASFFRICTQQLPTQISSFGQSWPWMFCPISCVCLMVDRVSMVTFCALGGKSLQEWLCPKLSFIKQNHAQKGGGQIEHTFPSFCLIWWWYMVRRRKSCELTTGHVSNYAKAPPNLLHLPILLECGCLPHPKVYHVGPE